jgi:hypothetical protein
MNKGDGVGRGRSGAAERGLLKLMLRLPAVRGQLQIMAAQHMPISNLFEAYDDASSALEQMKKGNSAKPEIIREYETICAEIETEVILACLERR